jgi:hypothetical protein
VFFFIRAELIYRVDIAYPTTSKLSFLKPLLALGSVEFGPTSIPQAAFSSILTFIVSTLLFFGGTRFLCGMKSLAVRFHASLIFLKSKLCAEITRIWKEYQLEPRTRFEVGQSKMCMTFNSLDTDACDFSETYRI